MTDAPEQDSPQNEIGTVMAAPAGVHTAYFYYIEYADGERTISVYEKFQDTALGSVGSEVPSLIDNHLRTGNNPKYGGNDFDDIVRKRKGYFIVALDGASFSSNDPITFRCDASSETDSIGNNGKHTFTPLGTFNVVIGTKNISVTAYLYRAQSYIRPANLGNTEREHYHIKFDGELRAELVTLYEESGGTNLGPPPRPPVVPIGPEPN